MDSPAAARPPLDVARLRDLHRGGRSTSRCTSSTRRARPTAWRPSGRRARRPRAWSWSPSTRPPAGVGSTGSGRPRTGRRSPSRSCSGPTSCRPRWPWLPLLIGRVRGRRPAGGRSAPRQLKWPNDVLLGDRKVAGILVERVETPIGPAAVAGVGINVSTTADELPVPEATSLAVEGVDVDRTDLLVAVLGVAGRPVRRLAGRPGRRSRAAYVERCGTVRPPGPGRAPRRARGDRGGPGRRRVRGPGRRHGRRRGAPVSAGDVVHVRPADQ